jgi:hypothetical protein
VAVIGNWFKRLPALVVVIFDYQVAAFGRLASNIPKLD